MLKTDGWWQAEVFYLADSHVEAIEGWSGFNPVIMFVYFKSKGHRVRVRMWRQDKVQPVLVLWGNGEWIYEQLIDLSKS